MVFFCLFSLGPELVQDFKKPKIKIFNCNNEKTAVTKVTTISDAIFITTKPRTREYKFKIEKNLVRDNACRGSRLVGVRGFEPPASWSRTKHSTKRFVSYAAKLHAFMYKKARYTVVFDIFIIP